MSVIYSAILMRLNISVNERAVHTDKKGNIYFSELLLTLSSISFSFSVAHGVQLIASSSTFISDAILKFIVRCI